mmetsp:Transcript_122880/g.217602  ORF Transcript_122880/g.217602 Transcript_122880/m.217602 type:complete len:98 (-) Transcript_122880:115-408(-)
MSRVLIFLLPLLLGQVDVVLARDEYYQNIFTQFDKDNDGKISEDEFIPLFSKDVQDIETALDQFREFDEDGSGFMNEEELWSYLDNGQKYYETEDEL